MRTFSALSSSKEPEFFIRIPNELYRGSESSKRGIGLFNSEFFPLSLSIKTLSHLTLSEDIDYLLASKPKVLELKALLIK